METLTDSFSLSGNTDIQNGNMKLILGLIWSLIAHYQLGASNFPPKKLMLAWLKVSLTTVHRLLTLLSRPSSQTATSRTSPRTGTTASTWRLSWTTAGPA